MSLQQRLDRIREGFERKAPADVLAVMHRATDDLRSSETLAAVVGEGRTAPQFALDDSTGRSTDLSTLLAQGPLVLTFFRGDW